MDREAWREVILADVADIIMGQSPPSSEVTEVPAALPFLQGNAEFGERHPAPRTWIEKARKVAPAGASLVSVRAPVGDVNVADLDYAIGRGVAAVAARSEVLLPEFLFRVLSYSHKHFVSRAQGTTFEAINKSDLRDLTFLLPTIAEQRTIAAILSSVDDAIAATRKVIEQTERVKKGLLQTLMTRGIGHTRFKQTEIGEIPEEWDVVALAHVISRLSAGVSVRSEDRSAADGELGILKTGSVARGRFFPAEHKTVLPEERERVRESPRAGRIIISRMNTQQLVGESGYVHKDHPDLFLPDRLWQTELHADAGVDAEWLSLALISPGIREQIRLLGSGTSGSMKNISQKRLLNLKIPKPPKGEQAQAVHLVNAIDSVEAQSQREKGTLERLKRGLLQDLLTGRVRVPMD